MSFHKYPKSILFELTHKCNLKCIHCYEPTAKPDLELTTNQVKNLIDQASGMGVPHISFGGGEALVRPDIFELLKYATDKGIAVELLSNGMLITDTVASKLSKCGVSAVSLSLDSAVPETHNAIRRGDCFDKVIVAIGNLTKHKIRVEVNSVFTKLNRNDFKGVVELSKELGVSTVRAVRLVSLGRAKENNALISPDKKDYEWFSNMLYDVSKEYSDKGFTVTGDDAFLPFLYIRNKKERMSWLKGKYMGCIGGRVIVSIDPFGNVYPCGYLKYSEFCAGNIKTDTLQEIWSSPESFKELRGLGLPQDKCNSCEHIEFCRGGCRGAAYLNGKSLTSPDPYCWIQ